MPVSGLRAKREFCCRYHERPGSGRSRSGVGPSWARSGSKRGGYGRFEGALGRRERFSRACENLCRKVKRELQGPAPAASDLRHCHYRYRHSERGRFPHPDFSRAHLKNGKRSVGGPYGKISGEAHCLFQLSHRMRQGYPDYGRTLSGEGEGPEYETVYALGSNCGVGDLAALTKANYICNEMGMDTISMGATVACAMEMYEKGILSESQIGRPLPFGDAEGLIEMCRKTAAMEGFGKELAMGSLRLATAYGCPDLAVVSKGQEFAGYDPRGEKGMGLAYATSNIGATHMRGDPAYIELLGVPMLVDPLALDGKAQLVKDWQDVFALIDSAGLCVFFSVRNLVTPTRDIRPDGLLKLLNAATGAKYDVDALVRAGERIISLERLFLKRAGFGAKDDALPKRITGEPLPDGPAKGHVCELNRMLPEYYTLRGWTDDGGPGDETLKTLGLEKL